jgi:hypothetical protein
VIPFSLARAQLRRPTTRVVALGAAVVGAWYAWSPGAAFGLSGALGGWQFAGRHLLDAGLVLVAVAGALTGAGVRERHLDEQLHGVGVDRRLTRDLTSSAAALVGLAVAAAFGAGTAVGGLVRVVERGGPVWIDPVYAPTVADGVESLARLALAAALVGALAGLIGWAARREDLAAAIAVGLALPHLEQSAALFGRLPPVADALAFGPWGALRAVALADRGLAGPGYERPTAVVPFVVVTVAWIGLAHLVTGPPRAATEAVRAAPVTAVASRRRLAVVAAALVVVVAGTVAVGAAVPPRLADALPWRWQPSWRASVHDGWSSTQTTDVVVRSVREGTDPGDRLADPDALTGAVADSLRRASRVERQPESTMRGPDQVVVRLRFDDPVRSGAVAFTDYLVRFSCEVDDGGRWRIVRSEGPVASGTAGGSS